VSSHLNGSPYARDWRRRGGEKGEETYRRQHNKKETEKKEKAFGRALPRYCQNESGLFAVKGGTPLPRLKLLFRYPYQQRGF